MGQAEILEVLEKHPDKWLTAKDISVLLGVGSTTVHHGLKALRNSEDVKHKFESVKTGSKKIYFYKHKETHRDRKRNIFNTKEVDWHRIDSEIAGTYGEDYGEDL